jgi:flagellar hook-basal body complex protein FliE
MIERATSPANIQAMLQTLRSVQAQAAGQALSPAELQGPAGAGKSSFSAMVKGAVEQVNDVQMRASELRTAYDRGDNVPLTDVVLGMQKSSLAFEATLQVRNKVLKAYEDVLNMPV